MSIFSSVSSAVSALGSAGRVVGIIVSGSFLTMALNIGGVRTAVVNDVQKYAHDAFIWLKNEVVLLAQDELNKVDGLVPGGWQGDFSTSLSRWGGFFSWTLELKFGLGLLFLFLGIQAVIGLVGIVKKCIPFISG